MKMKMKIKIWTLLGKWVCWVWVWFYPQPVIFMGFSFFKTISTQAPNPTHFFGFFLGWVWRVFLVYPTHVHPK